MKEKKEKEKKPKKEKKVNKYEEVRNYLLEELTYYDPSTEEYGRIMDALGKLNDAQMKCEIRLDPNKTLSAAFNAVTVTAIALLDRHVPLLGKAWSFLGGKFKL